MRSSFKEVILKSTLAQGIGQLDPIQELWSGYGKIIRVNLLGASVPSVVAKNIILPKSAHHPRGWDTNASHQRKIKSYEIELEWYKHYSQQCDKKCRVPNFVSSEIDEEEQLIVLEDLNVIGFSLQKVELNKYEVKQCLEWLANFHGTFLNVKPEGLWDVGTYWHLSTRQDEFNVMKEGVLKENAFRIDELLSACKYKTFVHGDAKVANFCFSIRGNNVAAVDFQYVGGGCGMKDVAYFLGSCLNESQCSKWEVELLESYFNSLRVKLESESANVNFDELEEEWRKLYPVAWTDFSRFLYGWVPAHQKLNAYSKEMEDETLALLFRH